MSDEPNPGRRRRETFLSFLLTAVFGGGFLLFLILVSGGFFFYVLVAVALIAFVGFFHYVLWGQAMMQNTAGEREELEARARWEADDESRNGSFGPRHYS